MSDWMMSRRNGDAVRLPGRREANLSVVTVETRPVERSIMRVFPHQKT